MKFRVLKQKNTRWVLSGVSKEVKDLAQKNAKKEDVSVPDYLEKALIQALAIRANCQEITSSDDIKGIASLLSRMDKRLSALEKVAANSEHMD